MSPSGIAANPVTGNIYVADSGLKRINEFTAWGVFIKAWGWGVRDGSPELQTCTSETGCLEGLGDFGIGGSGAGEFAAPQGVAVDSGGDVYVAEEGSNNRIQKFDSEGHFLRTWGGGVVSGGAAGTGDLTSGSTNVVNLTTTSKAFEIGQTVTGTGIPAGTTVRDLGIGTLTLSKAATASGTGVAIVAPEGAGNVPTNERKTVALEGTPTGGSFTLTYAAGELQGATIAGSKVVTNTHGGIEHTVGSFHVGDKVVHQTSGVIPTGTTIAAIDTSTGSLTLSANATSSDKSRIAALETTSPILYNASAAEVQAKVEALAAVGAGNVAVEGPAGGPWTIEFKGPLLGDVNLEPLEYVATTSADASGLIPSGTKVTVTTLQQGASAAEICVVAADCRAGIEGIANRSFAEERDLKRSIAVGPSDQIYVGGRNQIQEFNTAGIYQGQLELPEPGTVESLAVDQKSGNLYFAYFQGYAKPRQPNVFRLDPSTGKVLDTLEVNQAHAIGVDSAGNVYVADDSYNSQGAKDTPSHYPRILEFGSDGKQIARFNELKLGNNDQNSTTGIATNPVTNAGGSDVYLTSDKGKLDGKSHILIEAYGPPPEKWLPPAAAPLIDTEYATSVDPFGATLVARINPRFWTDTTYYVQYGDHPCSEGGCAELPAAPGSKLGAGVVSKLVASAGIYVGELAPATTYHYRFVAQSGGGGPTYGADRTFRTFPAPEALGGECPNQAFRTEASAALPDCRAYEMVSPLDKNNGDILSPNTAGGGPPYLYQATAEGDKLAYTSYRAFADPQSAAYINQYIATRGPEGWASESISPPREGPSFTIAWGVSDEFLAFSPDLSSGWLRHAYEPTLAPGSPPGYTNLYRRDNVTGTYEAITTVAPPHGEELGEAFQPRLEGFTADGSHAVFSAPDKLTPDARNTMAIIQTYVSSDDKLSLLSVLPDGSASKVSSSLGSGDRGNTAASARDANSVHAISDDGSRIYWTAQEGNNGEHIYLRSNPDQPESARLHGAASGMGDLIGPASGIGTLLNTSTTVSSLKPAQGFFVAGQEISSPTAGLLAAGTTVLSCSPSCGPNETSLTLSAKPLKTKGGAELNGIASAVVSNLSTETGAFAVGQEISGEGIPVGATVSSVGSGTLTLSTEATASKAASPLSATSPCTEPSEACTVPVSVGRFWLASPDGSRAIFSSQEDLYEFDAEAEATHLIAHQNLGAVAGASEDASRVYFGSNAALTGEEANSEGEKAQAGEPNLYLYEVGTGVRYVATLKGSNPNANVFDDENAFAELPWQRTSRVSPNGRYLAFMSQANLTGYDNTDAASGNADAEVYRYDAASKQLSCVSCNPSGARPSGREVNNGLQRGDLAARIHGWQSSFYATNPLAEDGSRLFFESYDALIPRDTNGRIDVYEWEVPGNGSCTEESAAYSSENEGCVYLISSGQGAADTEFADATPSGDDVFILTTSSLLPQDTGLLDLYDARVGGGYAPAAGPPAACEGEACQGTVSPPNDPTPASASFEGAGNVREEPVAQHPKPCAKGKVRRKGHCVSKHPKKAHKRAKANRRAAR
jgi:hypothetical protein